MNDEGAVITTMSTNVSEQALLTGDWTGRIIWGTLRDLSLKNKQTPKQAETKEVQLRTRAVGVCYCVHLHCWAPGRLILQRWWVLNGILLVKNVITERMRELKRQTYLRLKYWLTLDFMPNMQRCSGCCEKLLMKQTQRRQEQTQETGCTSLGANEVQTGRGLRTQTNSWLKKFSSLGARLIWASSLVPLTLNKALPRYHLHI